MKIVIFLTVILLVSFLVGYLVAWTLNHNRNQANKRVQNVYEKKLLYDELDDLSAQLRRERRKLREQERRYQ